MARIRTMNRYKSSRKRPHYALFLSCLMMSSSISFTAVRRISCEPRHLLMLRWMSTTSLKSASSSASETNEEGESGSVMQDTHSNSRRSYNKSNSTRISPAVYHSSLMKQQRDFKPRSASRSTKVTRSNAHPSLLPPPPSPPMSSQPINMGGSDGSALPNLPSWEQLFQRTWSTSSTRRQPTQSHQARENTDARSLDSSSSNNNNIRKIGATAGNTMNQKMKIKNIQANFTDTSSNTDSTKTSSSQTGLPLPPLSQLFGLNNNNNNMQLLSQQYDSLSSTSSSTIGLLYNHSDKVSLLLPNFTFYTENTAKTMDTVSSSLTNSLDGVLPVSELFYRSTQAMSTWQELQDGDTDDEDDDDEDEEEQEYTHEDEHTSSSLDMLDNHDFIVINSDTSHLKTIKKKTKTNSDIINNEKSQETDDNELPFSAEQSDQILINNNKVKVRRNLVQDKRGVVSNFLSSPSQDVTNQDTFQQEDGSNMNLKNNEMDPTTMTKENAKATESFIDGSSSSSSIPSSTVTPMIKKLLSSSLEDKNKAKKSSSSKKKGLPTSSTSSSSPLQQQLQPSDSTKDSSPSFSKSMKMIRRGMEMLVGGVPINVDPPLRFIELNYNFSAVQSLIKPTDFEDVQQIEATPWAMQQYNQSHDEQEYEKLLQSSVHADWATIITTNSRDFGPLLHGQSVPKTSTVSRQLYCEYMSMAFVKWNVGPQDYEELITLFEQGLVKTTNSKEGSESSNNFVDPSNTTATKKTLERIIVETKSMSASNSNMRTESTMSPPSSFHFLKEDDVEVLNDDNDEYLKLGGDLKFSLDVTRNELESMYNGTPGLLILNRVIRNGLANAIKSDSLGFDLILGHVFLNELDGGATEFTVEFHLTAQRNSQKLDPERAAKKINAALAQAMDDGEVALAMGAAAKMEFSWPDELRERIVEEFLFEVQDEDNIKSVGLDDDDDFESSREKKIPEVMDSGRNRTLPTNHVFDGPFGMPGDAVYGKNDIFLGGGNGGVFYDYSENGISKAPFRGALGPLLLDAVIQRSIQRQPRLIVIGDVHGCIDELQALLRKCDYRIGDLVLFLGDLVSKGPDSLSVVQMAREIGAIGVRGNHDFEVIRWHQAMKSGADPPVIGSEHFQIAMQLSKADLRWMYSLPWYISSKDLGALFVHAGFVSGIRLAKQNPRLLMNMRSILPDGTVTSKFFKSWPWARLWDGPQTVFFGHDADRDLQSYEHAIGLDTGCVYGGRLTACILPEKRLVSVNAKRQYFQYRRRQFD